GGRPAGAGDEPEPAGGRPFGLHPPAGRAAEGRGRPGVRRGGGGGAGHDRIGAARAGRGPGPDRPGARARPGGALPRDLEPRGRRAAGGRRTWLTRLTAWSPGGVRPRGAVRPLEQPVRLVVADDLVLLGVPGERPAELLADVRQDAARRRDVPLLDVGHRLA